MIEAGATKGIEETIWGGSSVGRVALFSAEGEKERLVSKERRKGWFQTFCRCEWQKKKKTHLKE